MRLGRNEKKILNYLSQAANKGALAVPIDDIAKRLDTETEKAKEICHPLHADELIESYSDRFFSITAAGRYQLKPWWRRHIVLIVAVATFIVAAVAGVFTILLYLHACE